MYCHGLSPATPGVPVTRARSRPLEQDVCAWRGLEQTVAFTFSVPLYELRATKRRRAPVAFARQVTMYIANTVFGMSYQEIGRLCRRDRRTVAHACELVERRRDDPALNWVLNILESFGRRIAENTFGDAEVRR